MKVSAKDWQNYIEKLNRINTTAAQKMQAFIDANGAEDNAALVEYAYVLATKYGEASGALACEMYDAVADASNVTVAPAVMADTATYNETAKAVNGTMLNMFNTIPQTVSRLVKQVPSDTMLQNAKRDGAQFAWIPAGNETCAFCITLASRGWQYMSKKALKNGHAEHIHANCQCEYAISFDTDPRVEGYDPNKYLKIYQNADGTSPQDKVNSIRRMQYAKEKAEAAIIKNGEPVNKFGKVIEFVKAPSKIERKNADIAKQFDMLKKLSAEYNTRLEVVTGGAKNAAGDVDISGARMRLTSSKMDVAVHEFAHTLANSLADKYGLTNDKEFWNEVRKIRTEYRKAIRNGTTERISFYADGTRDIDEFMAEAFAHAKGKELGIEIPPSYGTDFTYSQKVLAAIDKYFKKH